MIYKFVVELIATEGVSSTYSQAKGLLESTLLSSNKFTEYGEYPERGSFESLKLLTIKELSMCLPSIQAQANDEEEEEKVVASRDDILDFIEYYQAVKKYIEGNFLYLGETGEFEEDEVHRIREEFHRLFTAKDIQMLYWWMNTEDKSKVKRY